MKFNAIPVLNLYGQPKSLRKLVGKFTDEAHAEELVYTPGLTIAFPEIEDPIKAATILHLLNNHVKSNDQVWGSGVCIGEHILPREQFLDDNGNPKVHNKAQLLDETV